MSAISSRLGSHHPAEHVIFGAGAVGLALAEHLVTTGAAPTSIRVVNRSGRARVPAGVQTVGGECTEATFTTDAAHGARVVYQVLNAPYHRWPQEFPSLQAAVVAAAEATNARLVTLENVYAYGPPEPHGTALTEDTPVRATTRKGRVRASMSRQLLAAHESGRVKVAIGRASNYFGPRGGISATNLGNQAMQAALSNGRARVIGDCDQAHTYTYLRDIAAGLAVLGAHPDATGEVWHLPNDPSTRTTRQLLDIIYRVAGHPGGARITVLSPLLQRAIGLVVPAVRELAEMRYEFEAPFIVDSSRIADKLGVRATPIEQALAATLDSYR